MVDLILHSSRQLFTIDLIAWEVSDHYPMKYDEHGYHLMYLPQILPLIHSCSNLNVAMGQWFLNLLSNQAKPATMTGLMWLDRRFKNHWLRPDLARLSSEGLNRLFKDHLRKYSRKFWQYRNITAWKNPVMCTISPHFPPALHNFWMPIKLLNTHWLELKRVNINRAEFDSCQLGLTEESRTIEFKGLK